MSIFHYGCYKKYLRVSRRFNFNLRLWFYSVLLSLSTPRSSTYTHTFTASRSYFWASQKCFLKMIFLCLSNTLQFENGYAKRSPPCSPSAMNPNENPLQSRVGQTSCGQGTTKRVNTCLDWEPNRERSTRGKSLVQSLSEEVKDVRDLIKVCKNILLYYFFFLH